MVNVDILAIQCSKPQITKVVMMPAITRILPLSDFIRVPVHTARQTRKLHKMPRSISSEGWILILSIKKLL